MIEIITHLIVPIATAIIGSPFVVQFLKQKRELKQQRAALQLAQLENQKLKDKSIGVVMDLKNLNKIKYLVDQIYKHTQADRFLILAATNGTTELRFATALYEQHRHNGKIMLSVGAVNKYVEFEFDSHYLGLLKQSETRGIVDVDVHELPEACDIGKIYRGEGVTFSKWLFLDRKKIDEHNDRLFYCSVATHAPTPFTEEEKLKIRGYIGNLKTIIREL